MIPIHELVHGAISAWAPFAAAAAVIAAAAVGGALLVASRGAGRLSARSRYALVAIALLVPVAALLLIPMGAGGWASLIRFPQQTPVGMLEGAIATDVQFASAAASDAGLDAACLAVALWASAFLLIVFARLGEWMAWRRLAKRAEPLDDARVIAVFYRAWPAAGVPPELRMTAECEEPMVIGFARPVVLLPMGYGERMDDAEIEAVAVHELEHVARRDNLSAALADLLTSLFWFDPFHWIARRRLLELREGACDERVLVRGLPARSYLSALAKTSHAAIESPAVACMSGFRIRERMDSIMTYANNHPRWIPERLVRIAGVLAVALIAIGIAGFAPAGAAIAAEDPVELAMGEHLVSIRMRPAAEGRILIDAEIRKPDGTLVAAPRLMAMAGESAEISTSVGGRLYRLVVTPAADGSGFAKLEVLEGDKVIDTVVRSVEAPAARMRKPAEPIDLHLTGADLKDVVKTFSELTGVEIKLAEGAEGKITLDVDDTPWDEALVRAVEPLGLKVVFGDGVIFIGPASDTGLQGGVLAGALYKRVDPPTPPPPGYERVGGDIKAPKVITRVDPQFTEEARKERIAGIVIIEALVGEDGLVRDVKVLKGLPMGLDQAAADAVRQWTFEPATRDGKPVAVVFNLTVNFKLDAGKKAEDAQP